MLKVTWTFVLLVGTLWGVVIAEGDDKIENDLENPNDFFFLGE